MSNDPKKIDVEDNKSVVMEFISACNSKDVEKMMSFFDEDTLYHNIPMEPIVGATGIRAVLEPFLETASRVEWVVKHIAETGNQVVLTERLDRFLMKDNWLELPVMGVFEVEGSTIRAWRDYFDLEQLRSAARSI